MHREAVLLGAVRVLPENARPVTCERSRSGIYASVEQDSKPARCGYNQRGVMIRGRRLGRTKRSFSILENMECLRKF